MVRNWHLQQLVLTQHANGFEQQCHKFVRIHSKLSSWL
jgi:hypothetical protein